MRLWTTASAGVRTCRLLSVSAITSMSTRSKPFSANGCADYRIPSVPETAGRVIANDLSILQGEFSLTQIWDRPASGRCFFEQVIRENIDLGRPEQVQLIFSRKLKKATVAE